MSVHIWVNTTQDAHYMSEEVAHRSDTSEGMHDPLGAELFIFYTYTLPPFHA
jgi:hypothetical protein